MNPDVFFIVLGSVRPSAAGVGPTFRLHPVFTCTSPWSRHLAFTFSSSHSPSSQRCGLSSDLESHRPVAPPQPAHYAYRLALVLLRTFRSREDRNR
mmetsp:Transcript_16953/g.68384  ORF Transcript_16953/g.68384 Transcript_16953/m.68384 type:complete len:96 (-) Transcript_16953:8-295(-)